jgi:hypothetical protein
MELPETRYARSGDVSIAYQVFGDGPFDLVHIPPMSSHVELAWQVPSGAFVNRRLASFSRCIRFDKRVRACRILCPAHPPSSPAWMTPGR